MSANRANRQAWWHIMYLPFLAGGRGRRRGRKIVSSPEEKDDNGTGEVCQEAQRSANSMMTCAAALAREERGQDLIEYALLAGLISLVAVTAVVSVGSGVNSVWVGVDTQVAAVPSP